MVKKRQILSTQLEQIKIKDLIPYARNARVHSLKQINQIAGSIKEFGFINPVLVDKENVIIAGHGRVLAAEVLKLKTIPIVRVEHLTDNQKRAYILADNRLAETSTWDDEMLKLELEELKTADFNIDIVGFEDFKFTNDFTPDLPSDEPKENSEQKFVVVVTCENYDEQQLLFNELRDRGMKVKV
jgi:hypothetical protein